MLRDLFIILSGLILLLAIASAAFGQTIHSERLYGEVKTPAGKPLSSTHIININQHLGTTTNKDGQFALHVFENDTIKITSIGYRTAYYIISGLNDYSLNKTFTLAKDTVDLTEVVIYPYPSTLKALKREFIELDLEDEPPLVDLHLEMAGITAPREPSTGMTITGPFSIIYDKFSRHGKMQRKFERMTKQEEVRLKATKIYNADLIKEITGLKESQQVEEFMEFCKFEPEFILNSTSFQLYMAINSCYVEFINKQE